MKTAIKAYNNVEVFKLKTRIGIIDLEFEYLNKNVIKATIGATSNYFAPFELPKTPCLCDGDCEDEELCKNGICK